MGERIPVIVDTDIGTNIDDALALLYLLRQPRCELIAVSIAGGEPERRASLARAILGEEGRGEIPVGSSGAVDLLRGAILRRPREIALLAIGPLTNVARLFEKDPAIPGLLRGIVSMAGSFGDPPPGGRRLETNASADPRAAAAVLDASLRAPDPAVPFVIIPLDVTMRLSLDDEAFRRRIGPHLPRVLADESDAWFRRRDRAILHDPLAAAAIFEPGLCRYEEGRAVIDLDREPGRTRWIPSGRDPRARRRPHLLAIDVDEEEILRHFLAVLAGPAARGLEGSSPR